MSDTKPSDEQLKNEHGGVPPRASLRRGRLMRAVVIVATLAGLALLAAACGGGSTSATAPPGSAGGGNSTDTPSSGLAYTQCMRAHGVPDFPDPSPNAAGKPFTAQSLQQAGVDLNSPQAQSAAQACQHLMPRITLSAAQRQQLLSQSLRYAACMRAHGVPDFPDPTTTSTGGDSFTLTQGVVSSPQFQTAAQACHSVDPGLAIPDNTAKKLSGSGGGS